MQPSDLARRDWFVYLCYAICNLNGPRPARVDFRLWHEPEIRTVSGNVRYCCESGPSADISGQPLLTPSGPEAARYSITSSARNMIEFGIAKPSAFAVVRLSTSSNLVGCKTGSSAGFAPLTMRPTYRPSCRKTFA